MEKADGLKYLIVSDGHEFRRQRKLHGFRGKEEDYLNLISSFNSLEKYSLCGLNFENSIVLNSIMQNGKSLKVLDLAHCQSLNLQCIEKIITNCVQLTEVNFDNTDLTESAINYICNNISSIYTGVTFQNKITYGKLRGKSQYNYTETEIMKELWSRYVDFTHYADLEYWVDLSLCLPVFFNVSYKRR